MRENNGSPETVRGGLRSEGLAFMLAGSWSQTLQPKVPGKIDV